MADKLPVSVLLSQALVAFTIELDNEFEIRSPHRSSLDRDGRDRSDVWLTSYVMWSSALRYIPPGGITIAELEKIARAGTNISGIERWGYVTVERPTKSGTGGWVLRLTPKGSASNAIRERLPPLIEGRWVERFGRIRVKSLCLALAEVNRRLSPALPDYLPIIHSTYRNVAPVLGEKSVWREEPAPPGSHDPLITLLARSLLALAIEYEREARVPLALTANVLRVLPDGEPVAIRDLPARSGVSKEAIAMVNGWLGKHGYLESVTPKGKVPEVRSTPEAAAEMARYQSEMADREAAWSQRLGGETMAHLRTDLEAIVGDGTRAASPLWEGLIPPPGSWRSRVRPHSLLPHFPMVLHRGGYPDGS